MRSEGVYIKPQVNRAACMRSWTNQTQVSATSVGLGSTPRVVSTIAVYAIDSTCISKSSEDLAEIPQHADKKG